MLRESSDRPPGYWPYPSCPPPGYPRHTHRSGAITFPPRTPCPGSTGPGGPLAAPPAPLPGPAPTHQHVPHVLVGPVEAAEAHAGAQQAGAAPHVAGHHLHLAHLHGLHVEHLQLHGLLHVGLQQVPQRVSLLVLGGQRADSKDPHSTPQPGHSDKSGSEMGQGPLWPAAPAGPGVGRTGAASGPRSQAMPGPAATVTPSPKQCSAPPPPQKTRQSAKRLRVQGTAVLSHSEVPLGRSPHTSLAPRDRLLRPCGHSWSPLASSPPWRAQELGRHAHAHSDTRPRRGEGLTSRECPMVMMKSK